MQLENKIAAVTGGSAGIGRAIAEAFLREGGKVAIMARNADKANKMLEEVGAGDKLIFIQGDATLQADVEGFVDKTILQVPGRPARGRAGPDQEAARGCRRGQGPAARARGRHRPLPGQDEGRARPDEAL